MNTMDSVHWIAAQSGVEILSAPKTKMYKYVQLIVALLPAVTTSANLMKMKYSVQLIARWLFVEILFVIYQKTQSPALKIVEQATAEMAFVNRMKIQYFVQTVLMALLLSVQIASVTLVKQYYPVQLTAALLLVEIEFVKLTNTLDSVHKTVLAIPSAVTVFAIRMKTQKSAQLTVPSLLVVMVFASWMNRSDSVLLIASLHPMAVEIVFVA